MGKYELKDLGVKEVKKEVFNLKKELFNLKLQRCSGQVKDTSQFKKLRIKIAQALTFLRQKL